jgi:type IX secretion system PorP/SprF family membrane protein
MTKRIFLSILVLSFYQISFGQDVHWSQFNDNQLFQNPGQAGHFDGDYRFIANYRDQWRSVTVPFSTFSMSADTKFKDYGVGLLISNDQAGDGKFRTVEVQGNFSRLFKITKDSVHTIRPGINFGMNHRQINWDALYFDSQYNGYIFNPSAATNETYQNDRKTNLSLGLGSLYEWRRNERFKVLSGFGIYNLNRPNQGFYTEKIQRDIRFTIFAKGTFKINQKWDAVPSLQFNNQGVYRELLLGGSAKYYLTSSTKIYQALYGGIWYRNRDAAYLTFGYDYKDFFAGISYDINFSKLVPASRARGGIEIAVRYIIRTFKPKRIIHRVCPDYI